MPAPSVLGPGFRTYNDPGGSEAGFIGNGTWARARDGHQAGFEAMPIGCARVLPDLPMPIPAHALQASYRNPKGLPATALVLRFATAGQAKTYYTGYVARTRSCGSSNEAALSIQTLWATAAAAAVVRTYSGAETFIEVGVLTGASVGLLATSSRQPATELAWTRRVAPRFAAVVDRR